MPLAHGSTEIDTAYVGTTQATAIFLGTTEVWTAGGYDSLTTTSENGPYGFWEGGSGNQQLWTPLYKQGVAFQANEDILVHGVRWWRLTYAPDSDVRPTSIHIGADAVLALATDSAAGPTLLPSSTGWVEILFDEPVFVPATSIRVLWATVEGEAPVNVAREPGRYGTAPTPSRGGLYTALDPIGRFTPGPTPTSIVDEVPGSVVEAWYWFDPLVTLSPPAPATPPVQVGLGTKAGSNGWGTGFVCPMPEGMIASDVVVMVISNEDYSGLTDPEWTCTGFTEVYQGYTGVLSVTVLVGTGFSGFGYFAPASTVINSSSWVAICTSAWRGSSPSSVIVGTAYAANPSGGTPVIPAVTTTAPAALLAVGQGLYGTPTFTPTMTHLMTGDVRQAYRDLTDVGSSGTTSVTGISTQPNIWLHVAVQDAP